MPFASDAVAGGAGGHLMVLGHGFADAADLPIPLQTALLIAGGAVLGAAALANQRGSRTPKPGRPLPGLTRLVDAPAFRATAQVVMLVALIVFAVVALGGVDRASMNPAPRALYNVFWPLLLVGSMVFGPVWRVINPLRLVTTTLHRLAGDASETTTTPVPPRVGVWPAVGLLAVFVWGELVIPNRPSQAAAVLTIIAGVLLVGGLRYGSVWFRHTDPFETASATLARLAPFRRASDGQLVVGMPRVAGRELLAAPGTGALIAVMIGPHIYDGLAETVWWINLGYALPATGQVAVDTLLMAACIAVVAGLVRVSTVQEPRLRLAWIGLIAVFAFGHYLPVVPLDGQVVYAQISDPFATGADLFGTAGYGVDVEFMAAEVAATLLLSGLIIGHAGTMLVGSDAVAHITDRRTRGAVAFTFQGIVLGSVLAAVGLRFL